MDKVTLKFGGGEYPAGGYQVADYEEKASVHPHAPEAWQYDAEKGRIHLGTLTSDMTFNEYDSGRHVDEFEAVAHVED